MAAGPKIKLTYFDARGICEPSRMMLAVAGVEFSEVRFPIGADFAHPEFTLFKETGQLSINLGGVPVLEYDNILIGQSKTIERFLATKFGFMGVGEIEAAHIDMVSEHIRDIRQAYQNVRLGKSGDDVVKAAKQEFCTVELRQWCNEVERALTGLGGAGHAIGTRLSLADITIYNFFVDQLEYKELFTAALETCPTLRAIVASTEVAVKVWLDRRPVTLY